MFSSRHTVPLFLSVLYSYRLLVLLLSFQTSINPVSGGDVLKVISTLVIEIHRRCMTRFLTFFGRWSFTVLKRFRPKTLFIPMNSFRDFRETLLTTKVSFDLPWSF